MTRFNQIYDALSAEPWLSVSEVAEKIGVNKRAIGSATHYAGTSFTGVRADIIKSLKRENERLKKEAAA